MTGIGLAIFLCVVLACGRPPNADVTKEPRHSPEPQSKVGKPAAQPTDPVKPMKVGGEVSAPKLISRPRMPWPDDPTECYQLGVAVFEGVIDRNGSVHDLRLIKGPDNEFTRATREAMAQQKFQPAMYRGKPVDVRYHVSINHVPVKKVKGPC